MSHDQFPAYRLLTLIMRQISSPIASRITRYAKSHPRFSRTVCVRTCEVYRRAEWRARCVALRAAGRRDAWAQRHPPPLPLTQAQQMGADILSEVVLFMLGAMIVVFEVNRQTNLKEAKMEQERETWLGLLALLKEIEEQLMDQQMRIDRLRALVEEIKAEGFPITMEDESESDSAAIETRILGGAKALASIFFWLHPTETLPKLPHNEPKLRDCIPDCCKEK